MTSDKNKAIENITYKHFKQPAEVDFGTKKTVYTYTATGAKLKTEICWISIVYSTWQVLKTCQGSADKK